MGRLSEWGSRTCGAAPRLRRTLAVLGIALGMVAGITGPASATTYHIPYGREFAFIVSHESGHCLGWGPHKTGWTVMRASYSRYALNNNLQPYAPTSTDIAIMNASRKDTWWGETKTTYITAPFYRDYIPVYNKTGRSAAFPAANKWEPGPLSIQQVYSEPAHGITIFWDWSLAYTQTAGMARMSLTWNGKFWNVSDCTIGVNPRIG